MREIVDAIRKIEVMNFVIEFNQLILHIRDILNSYDRHCQRFNLRIVSNVLVDLG